MNRLLSGSEYQVLVEQAPMLIWRANRSGECDYFNERWLAFRGRTLEQEYGNGWAEGVHPEDSDCCVKTYLGATVRERFPAFQSPAVSGLLFPFSPNP